MSFMAHLWQSTLCLLLAALLALVFDGHPPGFGTPSGPSRR